MKNFIEIQFSNRRLLIALHTIAGIADKGDKGCVISLNANVTSINAHDTFHISDSYEEIKKRISEAQGDDVNPELAYDQQ